MTTHPTGPPAAGPAGPGAGPGGEPTPARHWPGLSQVAEVPTKDFRLAQVQLEHVVEIGGVAAVDGPSGCGKTFAVDYFMHHHPVIADRPTHWVQLPKRPTTKALAQILARTVGCEVNRRDSEYNIVEDLMPYLEGSNRVIAIDEAQHLPPDGLQQLRYFHDRCFPKRLGDPAGWTLILVGSGVHKNLSGAAELANRVSAAIDFAPMERQALLAALREWNDLLRDLPPQTLLDLDHTHCRGNWRQWAQFLGKYIEICAAAPPRNQAEQIRNVKAAVKKMRGARSTLTLTLTLTQDGQP